MGLIRHKEAPSFGERTVCHGYIQQSDFLRVRGEGVRIKSQHSEIDDFVIAVGVEVFQGRLLSIPAAAVKGTGRPILLP